MASAAAAIAFPLALQLGWTVLVPALYIVARLAPTGQPSTDAVSVVLDAVFAVILVMPTIILLTAFRKFAGADALAAGFKMK